MRGKAVVLGALTAGLVALVGCHTDKYKLQSPAKDEMVLPPQEARFDNAPEEKYKKPPAKREEKTLIGNKMGGPGGRPGQFQ